MKATLLTCVALALALPLSCEAGASPPDRWRLPADRDSYLMEDDLVYARFLLLARGGGYRQINRDERRSAEVDRGRWAQDADGVLRLRSTCRALRPRALRGGPLWIVAAAQEQIDALPPLLAALRRFLGTYPDRVFTAGSLAEINVAGAATVRADGGSATFDRADVTALAARIVEVLECERSGTYLLEPVKSASQPLWALDGSAFGEADLPFVRRAYRVADAAPPPFYFTRIDAATYAHAVGRWQPLHLPGGKRMISNAPEAPPGPGPDAGTFPRRRDWWLLAVGLAVFFLFCLGSRGLNEPDEGRYANIARAMAEPGGDWWEPRESGFAHYDKPPLVYWTTALAFRAFGFNEWAARTPPLLGAVLALAGLGWAATRLYGARVAWWAVFACGTSAQFWAIGRLLSPDMLLTGWCTLAVAAWLECRHRRGAWGFWLVSLACWTLAWWTKATPALIPLAGVLVGTYVLGDAAGRRALRASLLLPAILALGSPWYLSMLHRYPELSQFFFKRELVNRVAGHVDGRRSSPFFYLPLSLGAWLPWWPVAAWNIWTRPAGSRFAGWSRRIGVEGWIVLVGLLLFSLVHSKLPTYTVVLAPWALLLIARGICGGDAARPTVSRLLPGFCFACVVLVGVVVLPPRFESRGGPNSSLRAVARYLRAQDAREIDSDHYWPGMEFYLPDAHVRYVLRAADNQRERASDPGRVPDRFVDPRDWLDSPGRPGAFPPATGERWLVRFRGQKESAFDPILSPDGPRKAASVGQFDLYHVTLSDGHVVDPAAASR